jgi:hypothetical protein
MMPKFDPLDIFARNFDARTSDFEASGRLGCELYGGDPCLEVKWWPKLAVIREKLSRKRVAEVAIADTIDGKAAVLHANGAEFREGILAELRDIRKAQEDAPENRRTILLSIRKDCAEDILDGTKDEEFRWDFPAVPTPFRVYAHVKGEDEFRLAFEVSRARPLEDGGFAWVIAKGSAKESRKKLGDFVLYSTGEAPKAYPQGYHIAREKDEV